MRIERVLRGYTIYASVNHFGWKQIYPLPHMRLDFFSGMANQRRFGIGLGWITVWAFVSITWPNTTKEGGESPNAPAAEPIAQATGRGSGPVTEGILGTEYQAVCSDNGSPSPFFNDTNLAEADIALLHTRADELTNAVELYVRPADMWHYEGSRHHGDEKFAIVAITREELRYLLTLLDEDWACHVDVCGEPEKAESPRSRPHAIDPPGGKPI